MFWSVRYVDTTSEDLVVRQNIDQPVQKNRSLGAMVTVCDKGGYGYAATPDTSKTGISRAKEIATQWAHATAHLSLFDTRQLPSVTYQARYDSPVKQNWNSLSLQDRLSILHKTCEALHTDKRIVDWSSSLSHTHVKQRYENSDGAQIEQNFSFLVPNLSATANQNGDTQTRSLHGRGVCRQGGLEVLDEIHFQDQPKRIADEAIQLLLADNCPSGTMDLLLDSDQMLLQIHESIGHPLELDRILGDERNYAGTSFVTQEMFGHYQYGSNLLNITFDPTLEQEFASYSFDDDGTPAKKTYLIQNGILKTPLGSVTSQLRSGLSGVANSRACHWNRPPIDRMANLNLEPGQSSLDDMIKNVRRGIYMAANTSWSIDDSRNKFQFGCEWAQLIENGKLTRVVKNPNYRGISATFWRNLKMVGDRNSFKMYGSPYCGKGEPNQCVRVGHASPACLFSNVDVFGGM